MILGKLFHPLRGLGPLPIRLVLAAVFIYHGAHKVGILGELDFQAAIAQAKGAAELVGLPGVFGYVLAFTELVGGACLAIGFLTRYVATALGFAMFMAAFKVHFGSGFDVRQGGYEYALVLLACCLSLLFTGAGTLSLDRVFDGKEE